MSMPRSSTFELMSADRGDRIDDGDDAAGARQREDLWQRVENAARRFRVNHGEHIDVRAGIERFSDGVNLDRQARFGDEIANNCAASPQPLPEPVAIGTGDEVEG